VEYTKPVILESQAAIEVIQGTKASGHPDVVEQGNPIPSNSAYETGD
jgi:hypothetical protein